MATLELKKKSYNRLESICFFLRFQIWFVALFPVGKRVKNFPALWAAPERFRSALELGTSIILYLLYSIIVLVTSYRSYIYQKKYF